MPKHLHYCPRYSGQHYAPAATLPNGTAVHPGAAVGSGPCPVCTAAAYALATGQRTAYSPHNPPLCWHTHNRAQAPNLGGWQARVQHARSQWLAVQAYPARTAPARRAKRALGALVRYGVPYSRAVALANALASPHALPAPGTQRLAALYVPCTQPAPYSRRYPYMARCLVALANGCAPATARYL